MATHSSILAWEIPWTEEPGGLQSMGLQRVGHDWGDSTLTCKSSVSINNSLIPSILFWPFTKTLESGLLLLYCWERLQLALVDLSSNPPLCASASIGQCGTSTSSWIWLSLLDTVLIVPFSKFSFLITLSDPYYGGVDVISSQCVHRGQRIAFRCFQSVFTALCYQLTLAFF